MTGQGKTASKVHKCRPTAVTRTFKCEQIVHNMPSHVRDATSLLRHSREFCETLVFFLQTIRKPDMPAQKPSRHFRKSAVSAERRGTIREQPNQNKQSEDILSFQLHGNCPLSNMYFCCKKTFEIVAWCSVGLSPALRTVSCSCMQISPSDKIYYRSVPPNP